MSDVPYSHEAETSLVGNFIDDPTLFEKHRQALVSDDFFSPGPRNIFRVLCDILERGEVIRLETVGRAIDKDDFNTLSDAIGKCRKGESDFAADLATVMGYAANRRRIAEIDVEREQLLTNPGLIADRVGRKSRLSFRRVSELSCMTFDDSDKYLGDRMLAAGLNCVMAGPAGIGKSRLLIQMALCCITGRDFLGMPTFAKGKRWLILQNENSNRRVQQDIMAMVRAFGVTNDEVALIEENFIIHTLEDDRDSFTHLENPNDAREVDLAIQEYKPAFVVFDPLNTFTALDLNSDQAMREISSTISRLVKKGDASRLPLLLHHSITGKAGAAKAVGWDKGSFARNSKVLVAWCRSQFNIAPRDPDDETQLLMSCGKCSDGKPFQPMGLRYCPNTGLYSVDPDFDLEAFMEEVSGPQKEKKIDYPKMVLEIVSSGIHDRPEIKKKLITSGDSASSTYRHMQVAISRRLVYEKDERLYVNKFKGSKDL